MGYDEQRLDRIFVKTDGYCHLCHKKLARKNYGVIGEKGAWNVEHSKPKNKGGTDHLNNLFPACIPCNQEKGIKHTKTIRSKNGVTRAPFSKKKKTKIMKGNMIKGGVIGGIIGGSIGNAPGAVLGSTLGAAIGKKISPKK